MPPFAASGNHNQRFVPVRIVSMENMPFLRPGFFSDRLRSFIMHSYFLCILFCDFKYSCFKFSCCFGICPAIRGFF